MKLYEVRDCHCLVKDVDRMPPLDCSHLPVVYRQGDKRSSILCKIEIHSRYINKAIESIDTILNRSICPLSMFVLSRVCICLRFVMYCMFVVRIFRVYSSAE